MAEIQVLIPHYHEPESLVKPLLDSLEVQQAADFSVIICDDGGDRPLSREFLGRYTFPIEHYIEEHGGLAATRNKLMDHATAECIVFCDADDMFFHAYGLRMVLDQRPFDFLISNFLEEVNVDGKGGFVERVQSPIYVHGKAYRLQFLRDQNIRFFEELTVNEDSAFHMLCGFLAENRKELRTPYYMWRCNMNSTVRSDPFYRFRSHPFLTLGGRLCVQEFEKRGMEDKAAITACAHILNGYRQFKNEKWPPDLYEAAIKPYKEWIREVRHYWTDLDPEIKIEMLVQGENRGITAEEIDEFVEGA